MLGKHGGVEKTGAAPREMSCWFMVQKWFILRCTAKPTVIGENLPVLDQLIYRTGAPP